jgi:Zn-dependent metallo-hydrolase RNA specificity domain
MNLIKHCEPESVVLVHGEKGRMEVFAEVVKDSLKIPCYYPANFEDLYISVKTKEQSYSVHVPRTLLESNDRENRADGVFLFIKKVESIHAPPKNSIESEFCIKLNQTELQSNSRIVEEGAESEHEVRLVPHMVVRHSAKDFKDLQSIR